MVIYTVVMIDICSREQWVHAHHDQTQLSALSNNYVFTLFAFDKNDTSQMWDNTETKW